MQNLTNEQATTMTITVEMPIKTKMLLEWVAGDAEDWRWWAASISQPGWPIKIGYKIFCGRSEPKHCSNLQVSLRWHYGDQILLVITEKPIGFCLSWHCRAHASEWIPMGGRRDGRILPRKSVCCQDMSHMDARVPSEAPPSLLRAKQLIKTSSIS